MTSGIEAVTTDQDGHARRLGDLVHTIRSNIEFNDGRARPWWLLISATNTALLLFGGLFVSGRAASLDWSVWVAVVAMVAGLPLAVWYRVPGSAAVMAGALMGIQESGTHDIAVLSMVGLLVVAMVCDAWGGMLVMLVAVSGWSIVAVPALGVEFGRGWALGILTGVLLGISLRIADRNLQRYRSSIREVERRALLTRRQERDALARDLHDVVAHQLTIVSLVAGSRSRSTDVAKLQEGLEEVRAASGEALFELRSLLSVLRSTGDDLDDGGAESAGASFRTRFEALGERLETLGFVPRVTVRGDLTSASSSVCHEVLRIAQEATTNVVKYAMPGTVVRMLLVSEEGDVRLRVESVPGPAAMRRSRPDLDSSRRGLETMRERAELCGGSLDAGQQGRLWVVAASLPEGAHSDGAP